MQIAGVALRHGEFRGGTGERARLSKEAVERIREFYAVERRAKELELEAEGRRALQLEFTAPRLPVREARSLRAGGCERAPIRDWLFTS